MIIFKKEDLTKAPRGIIAHGVNCQGAMGSGVAKAIRERWPAVYDAYKCITPKPIEALGNVQMVNVSETASLFVANCFTQFNYGRDGKKYANADAIKEALNRVYSWADEFRLDVHIPKIGCGLGGLSWEDDVYPIIEELDNKYSHVDTYVYEI